MMKILLIGGLWLDGSAWDEVVQQLQAKGYEAAAVMLPGQGAPPPAATLDDQRAVVLAAVDAADGSVLVVGHSAAGTLAWLAADARPGKVARVAMIGGFPSADGESYAAFFEITDGVMPFPGWEPFDGPDSADLSEQQRRDIAAAAHSVPEAVATGTVHLSDDRRYAVPVTLICPEFSPDEARQAIADGDVPELAKAQQVDFVNIDSGHWPMFTQPQELARILAETARG